jgi:hypothetical protein
VEDNSEDGYKIPIDGKWDLEDLYRFPRAYEQLYYAMYSILPHKNEIIQDRIKIAYSTFPWQGGYSAVNFYNHLKYTIPKRDRPQILSLRYASLGWIELSAIVSVSGSIALVVRSISSSVNKANETYNNIHKGLSERKLLRIQVERAELELAAEHIKFIRHSNKELARIFEISGVEQINEKTGSELKTLKILLSMYRRFRVLCDFHLKGKAKF